MPKPGPSPLFHDLSPPKLKEDASQRTSSRRATSSCFSQWESLQEHTTHSLRAAFENPEKQHARPSTTTRTPHPHVCVFWGLAYLHTTLCPPSLKLLRWGKGVRGMMAQAAEAAGCLRAFCSSPVSKQKAAGGGVVALLVLFLLKTHSGSLVPAPGHLSCPRLHHPAHLFSPST